MFIQLYIQQPCTAICSLLTSRLHVSCTLEHLCFTITSCSPCFILTSTCQKYLLNFVSAGGRRYTVQGLDLPRRQNSGGGEVGGLSLAILSGIRHTPGPDICLQKHDKRGKVITGMCNWCAELRKKILLMSHFQLFSQIFVPRTLAKAEDIKTHFVCLSFTKL